MCRVSLLRSTIAKCLFFCVGLNLLSQSRADIFTLDAPSPTVPVLPTTAGSILIDTPGVGGIPGVYPPPSVFAAFPALGLGPGDVVDAISDGFDPVFVPGHLHYFSVTRGSIGAAGSGVFIESSVADTAPGGTPGQAGDIFLFDGGIPLGTNILAPAGFGWTLGTGTGDEANVNLLTPTIPPGVGDNVNSYDIGVIAPGASIYFSLAAGSPTLAAGGFSPSDIFVSPLGGAFAVFVPAAALGLPVGADIDALAFTAGLPVGPGTIEFSLTGATAGLVGATGGDILTAGVGIVHPFATLGLLPGDDLDALDVDQQRIPEPSTFGLLLITILAGWWKRKR